MGETGCSCSPINFSCEGCRGRGKDPTGGKGIPPDSSCEPPFVSGNIWAGVNMDGYDGGSNDVGLKGIHLYYANLKKSLNGISVIRQHNIAPADMTAMRPKVYYPYKDITIIHKTVKYILDKADKTVNLSHGLADVSLSASLLATTKQLRPMTKFVQKTMITLRIDLTAKDPMSKFKDFRAIACPKLQKKLQGYRVIKYSKTTKAAKVFRRIGVAGTVISATKIIYEIGAGEADVHTGVDGILLVVPIGIGIGVGLGSIAPVVAVGAGAFVLIYGIADIIWCLEEKLDKLND